MKFVQTVANMVMVVNATVKYCGTVKHFIIQLIHNI